MFRDRRLDGLRELMRPSPHSIPAAVMATVDKVVRDVKDRSVFVAAVHDDYGVVITDAKTRTVEMTATG